MNEYRMKELAVGQTEQFKVTVTEKMMKQFLEITGDTNPMHTDESYASKMARIGTSIRSFSITGGFSNPIFTPSKNTSVALS